MSSTGASGCQEHMQNQIKGREQGEKKDQNRSDKHEKYLNAAFMLDK